MTIIDRIDMALGRFQTQGWCQFGLKRFDPSRGGYDICLLSSLTLSDEPIDTVEARNSIARSLGFDDSGSLCQFNSLSCRSKADVVLFLLKRRKELAA